MLSKKSAANQALGHALRVIRYERGLNQEAFAAHAGLARSNYGAIERGEFNVTLDTIVKLAAGLGLSVAGLLARASVDGLETFDAV
jgi:transcriptional regulator with XRE-family HTH domain